MVYPVHAYCFQQPSSLKYHINTFVDYDAYTWGLDSVGSVKNTPTEIPSIPTIEKKFPLCSNTASLVSATVVLYFIDIICITRQLPRVYLLALP